MNALIETANRLGEQFLHFAWPMFWQSSLFIIVLFGLDFALRRRLRASVRYALWLTVFVKLLLPPTLALPTSIAWWADRPAPLKIDSRKITSVTYGQTVPFLIPPAIKTLAPSLPPSAILSPAGSFALISVATMLLLVIWLTISWWQIARTIRMAASGSAEIETMLEVAKHCLNLRRRVRLRMTPSAMSPAVCGLFRPTILIPTILAERLSPEQRRAVLLHELVHLRRGDVWINCVQTLVQIAYWWNPLLWLANARIRRVREEAVDDTVMLALRDEAETYAPTLLEVAKVAISRPLAGLRMVGILESRGALRQRIERLINFQAPRRAGLTLVSAFSILAFTALAVPMGAGPARIIAQANISTNALSSVDGSRRTFDTLKHIEFDGIGFRNDSLKEVMSMLNSTFSGVALHEKNGITFTADKKIKNVLIRINPPLGKVPGATLLDAIVNGSSDPIHYAINDQAVMFLPGDSGWPLQVKTFTVNPVIFLANARRATGLTDTNSSNDSVVLQAAFSKVGLDFGPPKSFYYVPTGTIMFRTTTNDFSAIETIVQALDYSPPQVNIKSYFVELNEGIDPQIFSGLPSQIQSMNSTQSFTGILTHTQFRMVFANLRKQEGTRVFSQPEITTLSGRQAAVEVVDKDLQAQLATNGVSASTPGDLPLPFDPMLDILPTVSVDGYAISMGLKSTLKSFSGYERINNVSQPVFHTNEFSAQAIVRDGQTIVLGNFLGSEEITASGSKNKRILIFITPTLINAAGERIHQEKDTPVVQNGISSQANR
ncbi:MAG TPA: M56 family metallopeptidase [Verrucomicrobiae bacterium]|nr:M56 family metallopeptidase [Verrucomicrobiae bacterium]